VKNHQGDKWIKDFTTRSLLNVMIFAVMSGKKSMRHAIQSLNSIKSMWYHAGLLSLSRNNISHALMTRSCAIFEEFFASLIEKASRSCGWMRDTRFKFKAPLRTIDSTTITMSLHLFGWAKYRKTKSGIKLHFEIDNRLSLPLFCTMTPGRVHDVTTAKLREYVKGALYALDRGYFCAELLENINKSGAFFIIRAKNNTQYRIVKRLARTHQSVKANWMIKLTGVHAYEYSGNLRLVRYYDTESGETYDYLTNNIHLAAKTISDIYRARWDIELFFKWIKQNLRIKSFYGTSENAVMIQVWAALIAYLLIAMIKFISRSAQSITHIFRVVTDNLIRKTDLYSLLESLSGKDSQCKDFPVDQLSFNF
jgi:putative transposase